METEIKKISVETVIAVRKGDARVLLSEEGAF
jgi:hypothetical protein